jgi:hypothetical protein
MTEQVKKNIPDTVKNKIMDLKKIEMSLGHLPNETWTVEELQKRTADSSHQQSLAQMEARSEILFAEICDELVEHHFNYSEIALAINEILISSVGSLKYCNEIEVREALGVD